MILHVACPWRNENDLCFSKINIIFIHINFRKYIAADHLVLLMVDLMKIKVS